MFSLSFDEGSFPDQLKHAIVRSRLKKSSFDPLDIKSYRPVSNPSFISKLIQWLVANRLQKHADIYKLFPIRQSADRRHHSTETAVAIVHNDIVREIDEVMYLAVTGYYCCFWSVSQSVLIDIMQHRFAVWDTALNWFQSIITNWTQSFRISSHSVRNAPRLSNAWQVLVWRERGRVRKSRETVRGVTTGAE